VLRLAAAVGQPVWCQRQRQLPVAHHGRAGGGVFFCTTLALAYFGNSRPASSGSVLETRPPWHPLPPEVLRTQCLLPLSAPASGAAQIPSK
jgi:hypothetical protein